MKTERTGAIVVLLLGIGYLWKAFAMEDINIGDPLGPKAFPIFLGAIMTVLGFSLLIKPEAASTEKLFGRATFSVAALAGMLFIYSIAIGAIGYPVSTFFFLLLASRLLGEKISPAGIAIALFFSLGVFLLFTRVLDIHLPLWGMIRR